MVSSSKLIAIHILQILNKYASADQRMRQEEIMEYLKQEYGEEITRHTCSDYLKKLREAGFVEGQRGVYLVPHFNENELHALIDGILFAGRLSDKEAIPLIQKLKDFSYHTMHDGMEHVIYTRRTESVDMG